MRERATAPKEDTMTPTTQEQRHIAIMDTTLRDGEQTSEVSYMPDEKLQLARLLLLDVEVDRLEIASSRVSEGERDAARKICAWARKKGCLQRVEILGYCDGKKSVDWIADVGGKVLNLLTKGSEHHCRSQLRVAPEKHRAAVEETVRYARRRRMQVNVYLEDWSNGVQDSFEYVYAMVQLLRELRVARIYLPDTLGILSPESTTRTVALMTTTWPEVDFEFHSHNDYNLATANCLAAIGAGARGVHTSVNGLGERAGNTRLAEVVAAIHDHTEFRTTVAEARLTALSRLVERFSGKEMSSNAPIVGRDVFTQTAGIHADGDAKGDLYANKLAPARFGRARRYALGKMAGKASLDHNLKSLGIDLPAAQHALVLARIVELGDRKHTVTPEDLPFLIADVLKTPREQLVRVESYSVSVGNDQAPQAQVTLSFRGESREAKAGGDGGYDAFMNATRKAARGLDIPMPRLHDFRVRIPPGGRTGALVETTITWRPEGDARPALAGEETFSTIGVDSDQLAAAIVATEKMLNAMAPRKPQRSSRVKRTVRRTS